MDKNGRGVLNKRLQKCLFIKIPCSTCMRLDCFGVCQVIESNIHMMTDIQFNLNSFENTQSSGLSESALMKWIKTNSAVSMDIYLRYNVVLSCLLKWDILNNFFQSYSLYKSEIIDEIINVCVSKKHLNDILPLTNTLIRYPFSGRSVLVTPLPILDSSYIKKQVYKQLEKNRINTCMLIICKHIYNNIKTYFNVIQNFENKTQDEKMYSDFVFYILSIMAVIILKIKNNDNHFNIDFFKKYLCPKLVLTHQEQINTWIFHINEVTQTIYDIEESKQQLFDGPV